MRCIYSYKEEITQFLYVYYNLVQNIYETEKNWFNAGNAFSAKKVFIVRTGKLDKTSVYRAQLLSRYFDNLCCILLHNFGSDAYVLYLERDFVHKHS